MTKIFKETERTRLVKLINDKNQVFYDGVAGKEYRGKPRDFIFLVNEKNLFKPIQTKVIDYFKNNKISWWGGKRPTGHVLSSQIACINHLFEIRNDKNAVMTLLNNISKDFKDILLIDSDKFDTAYIQFEAVSDKDNLKEGNPTRGNNCTSIDALIYAVHKDNSKWLIPIEWKYTEFYGNEDKSKEGIKKNPIKYKGKERLDRYTTLINSSNQLKTENHACFYFEPFYQLMRQTLWTEQLIKNKDRETLKAENYLHVHVIPSENINLLDKIYKYSGDNMEKTWRSYLVDQSKYKIITPENLLSGLDKNKYKDLLDYLRIRYWTNA
ncbi:MAG: PGN_0703 family putative restriction endonuclease [Bacteroidales bacterium]